MRNFDVIFVTYFPQLNASPVIVLPSDSSEEKVLVDQKEVQKKPYTLPLGAGENKAAKSGKEEKVDVSEIQTPEVSITEKTPQRRRAGGQS